jgi:Cd2+/Zn2+-exporting ATPase
MSQPQQPPQESSCTTVLSDTLKGYAGIRQVDFNPQDGQLKLAYDPHVLSPEHALKLVKSAGRQAWERASSCAQKSEGACANCLLAEQMGLSEHYRQLAHVDLAPSADIQGGQMRIRLDSSLSASPELDTAVSPVHTGANRPVQGLSRQKLEVIFTAVTFVAGLSAFLGASFGLLSGWVPTILYVAAFLAGGYYGTLDGLAVLREKKLDVNLLMVLAALGAAFIGQPFEGATLLFLFSLSNTLQSFAMDRSRKAIEKLLDLRPPVATVRRGSRLVSVPVEKLLLGETVVVHPGERFPIDGEVISGHSTADQSTITGESIPVHKEPGSSVFAGSLNGNGALEVRVTHLASDTTLAKIVSLVEEAQGSKAQTQRMLDNFEQVYAVLVLTGAALLAVVPLLFGAEFYPTFYRSMTWLVVASPCALVISTPASILSAIANGARRGILFKGGVYLEQTAAIKVVAFDKTGTLTRGEPALTGVILFTGSEDDLLRLAAAAESRSEHPVASAVVHAARERGLVLPGSERFQAVPGQGVEALVDGKSVWIGSERMFDERRVDVPAHVRKEVRRLEEDGQTVMVVYSAGEFLGLLAVADRLREEAREMVAQLKKRGVEHVVMLTGDNKRVAANIAARVGVDEFHAGLLPQDKVQILKTLKQKYGTTAMVGDGVNDAPALATADVGIAMGAAGTDVALETADVVLMGDSLERLPYAIGLAKRARRIVWQNLAFALAVIVLLVVTALGAQLPLPLGVVGHEGSTVLVVLNGLRLLGYRGG